MRVFFDTEFLENGETIRLISIGMVREDGDTYYAIVADSQLWYDAWNDDWLRENVCNYLPQTEPVDGVPGLDFSHPNVKGRGQIADEIIDFVGNGPEFWAYFADYDWVVLAQLYGRMIDLPYGWPKHCKDLKQLMDDRGITRSDLKLGRSEHHALADAEWNRDAYDQIMSGNLGR